MIPALAPAFVGPFLYFGNTVALPDDPRPKVCARDFFGGSLLLRSLEQAARQYPNGHRDAITARWARAYAAKVVPATIGATLLLNRDLLLDFQDAQLIIAEDCVSPCGFVIAHTGKPDFSRNVFARFERMIFGHFQPVIEALAEHGRTSPKVLWGNLSLYIDYFLRASATIEIRPEGSFAFDPAPLLTERVWPDGRPNPIFEPCAMTMTAKGPRLNRKTCCLTYRLAAGKRCCFDCPIAIKRERRAACAKEAA